MYRSYYYKCTDHVSKNDDDNSICKSCMHVIFPFVRNVMTQIYLRSIYNMYVHAIMPILNLQVPTRFDRSVYLQLLHNILSQRFGPYPTFCLLHPDLLHNILTICGSIPTSKVHCPLGCFSFKGVPTHKRSMLPRSSTTEVYKWQVVNA